MKVKIDKFCSLATSPSWQAWLFHFNADLYRHFMAQLGVATGCGQNRDIMIDLLKKVELLPDGVEKVMTFLRQHYPHILVEDAVVPVAVVAPKQVFPYYNPALLTYPRRQILVGDELEKRVREFLLDKIESDFVILDGKAYIEYLERQDASISAQLPRKNWQIATWRAQS